MTASLIDELARDVARLEALRAVKDAQRRYAHYQQYGRWTEMAALFGDDATLDWAGAVVAGRSEIGEWLGGRDGSAAGGDGLAPGALHTELIDEPLVNLSPDGRSAQGRWMSHAFRGDGQGHAWFEGGIYENDYAIDDGAATISAVRYFPLLAGDYADGWTNAGGGDLARFPFHFTADEAGIPIPPADWARGGHRDDGRGPGPANHRAQRRGRRAQSAARAGLLHRPPHVGRRCRPVRRRLRDRSRRRSGPRS